MKTRLEESHMEAKKENLTLSSERSELNSRCKRLQNEIKDLVTKLEINDAVIKDTEKKLIQATAEKRDYEILLDKLSKCIPNVEAQQIINEMLRLQKELHSALRSKEANDNILKNNPEELKQETIELATMRSTQINSQCDKLAKDIGKSIYKIRLLKIAA